MRLTLDAANRDRQVAEEALREWIETAVRDALRDLPSLHTGRLADHGDAYRLLKHLADAGYVVVPAVSGVTALRAPFAASPEPVDGLDVAWAAAMTALETKGPPFRFAMLRQYSNTFEAWWIKEDGRLEGVEGHPTPAAALQALAARLSGDPSEERT
jgi:hypothetical protein